MDAAALLAAWERGLGRSPTGRALALLGATDPVRTEDDWAEASIGARDAALLRLRERLFGRCMEVTAGCPRCGEPLEAEFTTGELGTKTALQSSRASFGLTARGYDLTFRLPTSRDLEVATDPAVPDGRALLLERCIERASRDGSPIEVTALPPDVTAAVSAQMGRTDPMAEIEIGVSCGSCGHDWAMLFDIAQHLWSDLCDWAERLLREVHVLASAYGWTEREVLRLSATRRRAYLDLLGA